MTGKSLEGVRKWLEKWRRRRKVGSVFRGMPMYSYWVTKWKHSCVNSKMEHSVAVSVAEISQSTSFALPAQGNWLLSSLDWTKPPSQPYLMHHVLAFPSSWTTIWLAWLQFLIFFSLLGHCPQHPIHVSQAVTTSQHNAECVLSALEQGMRSYLKVLSRTGLVLFPESALSYHGS